MGFGAQVARGEVGASSTRDVGAGKAGASSSGGGYARKTGLTPRAREQRESEGASARGESGRRQVLEQSDKLVTHSRKHILEGLRKNDETHRLAIRKTKTSTRRNTIKQEDFKLKY